MNDDTTNNDDLTVGEPSDASSLAALYALGALDVDDTARFEEHLASSTEAQADVVGFEATADLLSTGVEPPASLKASIMASIATLPQLPAEAETPAVKTASPRAVDTDEPVQRQASTPAPSTGSPAGQSARVSKAEHKARARWYSRPAAALAAAAALVAVFLGANALTSALNNGNGLTEALRLAHIEAQPDVARETIRLTNITDEKQVTATLVWSGALAESVFIVDGLASLPEDKTYELWYIGEDGPISAGVFNTHRAGESWRVLEGSMAAGDAVGVTVEPAGGSEQPTTDPLIVIHTT
ncbi:anti-sigma factor [Mycetocola zhujimingii]|uniref:Regulator of SigK n=1 Tax=Mycetocola zhujimingii TaxID=2079792 RepID=A0A2U1TDK4_9MICO|nr:anti-sigma factor [Mycetocola zhujimingii]PWC06956.1 hypothetical protein DF223_08235 [Mycetocola zhujimingii]